MTDYDRPRNLAEVIDEITRQAVEPVPLEPLTSYLIPAGKEIVDTGEQFADRPARKSGEYAPATVQAFIDYVDEHHTQATTIWVDKIRHRVTAVLNDHDKTSAGWGDYVARLQLLQTPEWKHWALHDGKWLDRDTFAEHLQDGVDTIRVPDAATLLEIAQSIQGVVKADFKSAQRLDNGEVSFKYHEEVEATAGRAGHLEIPASFDLLVAPFYGEQPEILHARLRYRIRSGQLTIGYKLDRPLDVIQACVDRISERLIAVGLVRTFMGEPPTSRS